MSKGKRVGYDEAMNEGVKEEMKEIMNEGVKEEMKEIMSEDVKEEVKEIIEKSPANVETTVPPTVTNGEIANTLHVKVRREPSFESEVLEVLRKGDKVKVLEKGNDFWKVSTSVNNIAYISSEFIKEE